MFNQKRLTRQLILAFLVGCNIITILAWYFNLQVIFTANIGLAVVLFAFYSWHMRKLKGINISRLESYYQADALIDSTGTQINTLAVGVVCKSSQRWLKFFKKIFEEFEKTYNLKISYYFLEDGSEDDTAEIIAGWLNNRQGQYLKVGAGSKSRELDRFQNLAWLRARLKSLINGDDQEYDWVLLLDADTYFSIDTLAELFEAAEAANLGKNVFSPYCEAIFGHSESGLAKSAGHYFDTFALTVGGVSFYPECPFDKCAICRTEKDIFISENPIIEVTSIFGGFLVVPGETFQMTSVDWKPAESVARCEHLYFCDSLQQYGSCKLYLIGNVITFSERL